MNQWLELHLGMVHKKSHLCILNATTCVLYNLLLLGTGKKRYIEIKK